MLTATDKKPAKLYEYPKYETSNFKLRSPKMFIGISTVYGNKDNVTKNDSFNNVFLKGICLILKLKRFSEIFEAFKRIINWIISAIQRPNEIPELLKFH